MIVFDPSEEIAISLGDPVDLALQDEPAHPMYSALERMGELAEISFANIINASTRPVDVDLICLSTTKEVVFEFQIIYPVCISQKRAMDLIKLQCFPLNYFFTSKPAQSKKAQRIVKKIIMRDVWN